MSTAIVAGLVQVAQAGLPAVLTNAIFKQLSELLYIKTSIGGYFFDAVFRTELSTNLTITNHPVQGGANISDHCYMEPIRITVELGVSDVGTSLISGQFASAASRAQAAFDALLKMQTDRNPVVVSTKFRTYDNMLIESIGVPEEVKTFSGMRAVVSLKQIIVVDVAKVNKVSARSQVTNSTSGGNAVTVTPKETTLYKIEKAVTGGT